MRFNPLLATILALLAVSSSAFAQTVRPIGEQYRDVSSELTDIGAKSVTYKPVDSESKQLFFIPFFAMKADKDGKLAVTTQVAPLEATALVTVWLLVAPQNKVDGIAAYIRSQEALETLDARFAQIQPSQLIGVPLSNLEITEDDPGLGFKSVALPYFGGQGEIQLSAEVPKDKAEQIAQDLRDGKRLPTFTVRFDLSARITESQSEIQANLRYFYETKAVRDLVGSAKAFKWNVTVSGVANEQPFVSRDQRAVFEGQLKNQIAVQIQLENEKDIEFINYMRDYFLKVFSRYDIDPSKGPFSQELARMSEYGFSPADLQPGEVDQLVADVKNFFKSEEEHFVNTEASAKASFLGFGGSAGFKYTKKNLQKRMEDKGWKFETNGSHTVPKSFEVHILNSTALKTEGVLSLRILRSKRVNARFNYLVSTSSSYYPQTAVDHLVRLEELQASVDKAKQDILHLATKTIEPDKLLYREKNLDTRGKGEGYLDFDASEVGPEWRVIGAGAWKQGGGPLPVRFKYRNHDVSTWVPADCNAFLTVVLLKVK